MLLVGQIRNFYTGKDFKGDPPLVTKIAAGLTTGAIGIMVASPTDLVKVQHGQSGCTASILSPSCTVTVLEVLLTAVCNCGNLLCTAQVRMQAEGKLPEGVPRKYPSAVAAYGIIAR